MSLIPPGEVTYFGRETSVGGDFGRSAGGRLHRGPLAIEHDVDAFPEQLELRARDSPDPLDEKRPADCLSASIDDARIRAGA